MADIEHRIVLQYIIYDNKEGDFKIEKHASLKPKDAVEKMAKALVEYEKINNPNACEWNDLKERAKDIYRERAKAVLNSLLGGKDA